MAFIPLIGLVGESVIEAVNGEPLGTFPGAVLYFLTYSLLSYFDGDKLEKSGYPRTNRWWVFFVPAYIFLRAKKLRQFPLYGIIWCLCFVAAPVISDEMAASSDAGVSEPSLIEIVRDNAPEGAHGKTIGTIIATILTEPEWEAFAGGDGEQYVNVTGGMIPSGETVVIQFVVTGKSFSVKGLTVNGFPVKDERIINEMRSMLNTGQAKKAA